MEITFKLSVQCEHRDRKGGPGCGKRAEFTDKPAVPWESAEVFAQRAAAKLEAQGWLLDPGAADLCPDHS